VGHAAARERGVTLFFASLQDLVEVNKANSDSWRPLFPIFDPGVLAALRLKQDLSLSGETKMGRSRHKLALLYDWSGTTLKDEGTSLRKFYADPETASRGDRCEIATPVAKNIAGRVVLSGAGRYRRDFRSKGLATILPRISRAYAFALEYRFPDQHDGRCRRRRRHGRPHRINEGRAV
jgi:hypothetical protein